MARSTSTPSAGGGSSKKRKAPTSSSSSTPGATAAATAAASSSSTAKKSKRESLEESRAKARAWAEEQKRKKRERAGAGGGGGASASSSSSTPSAKRSAATPTPARKRGGAGGGGGSRASTPSTSDAEMEEAEAEEEIVGTIPTRTTPTTVSSRTTRTTGTPTTVARAASRTTPTTGAVTVKKARTPGTRKAAATPSAGGIDAVRSPGDSASKKRALLEAKERARQWAVREKIVKPKHVKSPPQPAAASSTTRRTATPRRPPPAPHAPPGNGSLAAAASTSSSAAHVVLSDDDDDEEEDVEEESPSQPSSPAMKISHVLIGEGATRNSPGAGGGRRQHRQPQRGRGTAAETIPVEDDDSRAVGPPPPSGPSGGTVLDAASAAVASRPKTDAAEGEGAVSGETDRFLERAERAYRVGRSVLRLALVVTFLGCVLYAWSVVYGNVARQMRRAEDGLLMGGAARLHHRRAPRYCYLDSSSPTGSGAQGDNAAEVGEKGQEEEEEDGVQKCARTKPYPPVVPCPPRGVCRNGEWIECFPASLFVKDLHAGTCSLTDAARGQLGEAEGVLSRWTGEAVCGAPKGGETHRKGRREDGNGGTIWFDLNDLATEILVLDQQSPENGTTIPTSSFPDRVAVISDILVSIISHLYEDKSPAAPAPTLKLSTDLDEVALTVTGMAGVHYPFLCWSLIWLRHLTGRLLGWSWRGIESLALLCVAQPLPCAAFVALSYLALLIARRRRRRARIRADTEEAKAIAYEKLVGVAEGGGGHKPEPYPVLHLRTDVANDMYPRSRKEREGFFAQAVWPRVVVEMRADVRIERCQMSVGSTPQECWVWLGNRGSSASTPASARRERGKTGRRK